MRTTAQKPATTPIPVQLSAPEVEVCILPHLSMPNRGLKCTLGYCHVSGRVLVLPGLRRSARSQRLSYSLIPHLVRHLQALQPAALPLPLPAPQDDLISPARCEAGREDSAA
jgi:hypothetical protein